MRFRLTIIRMLLACLVTTVTLPIVPSAPLAAAPALQAATFTPTTCPFDLPLGAVEGQNLECGYVLVPEQHENPDGPTIRLEVAIVRSGSSNPAPDPLVMLQGGPGGSTIDTYTSFLFPESPLRANRDIILFDQRGTLYTEPALLCEEFTTLTEETIEQDLPYEEGVELSLQALFSCRDRLLSEGVNLPAFDSLQNAADIEALRVAMGYDQINLFGVSYGTLLALHTMRDHPEGLRSVILDAVVPTQLNFVNEVPNSQARAFNELFEACANDPGCNAAFPNLERTFFSLVDQLNAQPARVTVTDSETGATYNAVLNGDSFLGAIFQMLYVSEIIPALPVIIDQARNGEFTFLARVLSILAFDRTFSGGMHYSVVCAEESEFAVAEAELADMRPVLAEDGRRSIEYYETACAEWGVPQLDPFVNEPVESDIPTLVLNGRFDPITPPAFGELAAETLNQSYVYTFPTTGHGAATAGECPASIVLAFLDNPNQAPDAGCIDEQTEVDFLTPDTLLLTPALANLLTELERGQFAWLVVLFLGVLLLLSAWVVLPIAWIVNRLRQNPAEPQPRSASLGIVLALLAAALSAVFVIGLIVVVFQVALENELILFFGVPIGASWLFALPLTLAVLTLGMVFTALRGWQSGYWSRAGRVYYTLLTLAAATVVAALAQWGMVFV